MTHDAPPSHWSIGLNDIERRHVEDVLRTSLRPVDSDGLPTPGNGSGPEPLLVWIAGRSWMAMSLAKRREVLAWEQSQKVLVLGRNDTMQGLEDAMDAGFLSVVRAPLTPGKLIAVMDRAREVQFVYNDIMRMTREISLEREILARKTDYLLFLNRVMARAVESLNPATILTHARKDIDLLVPLASVQGVFWHQGADGQLEAELFLAFQEEVPVQERWVEIMLDKASVVAGRKVDSYQLTYLMDAPEEGAALPDLSPDPSRTILLPLKAGGRDFGCLVLLTREPARLAREQTEVLHSSANHLGLALKNALLFREVKIRADYDGLTRIYNRQSFDGRLMEELKRQQRYGHDLSLMIVDLDHFKKVNDTYGHQAGDEVLREVGKLLADTLRETDFAARYGGEEFGVILPHTGQEDAFALADRLRVKIAKLRFDAVDFTFGVTASIGVASTSPGADQRAADLLRRADTALYEAKHNGRDRVCQAASIQSPAQADKAAVHE